MYVPLTPYNQLFTELIDDQEMIVLEEDTAGRERHGDSVRQKAPFGGIYLHNIKSRDLREEIATVAFRDYGINR